MKLRKILEATNSATGATVKVYRNSELDEFVCKLVGSPGADYFTPDKDDAINTAWVMVGCPTEFWDPMGQPS